MFDEHWASRPYRAFWVRYGREAYLKRTGYRHGPLFRAQKNGRGGPLS